jgi:hypothetical protein
MTILITSDLSLTDNSRDEYRFTFLEQTLPKLIAKHKVSSLYMLGDITEAKDNHGAWLVNRIADGFYKLAHDLGTMIILAGNHDYVGSQHPFFCFLDMVENIIFIDKPQALGEYLFLPHTSNYQRDWKLWKGNANSFDYVFAHNTFAGAMANGMQLPGIPLDYFPRDTLILAGDVHTPQQFKHLGRVVCYVGAPYTVDFGDDYQPRVLLLDAGMKSVSVPGPQKRVVLVDTRGKPINKIELKPGDILKVRVPLVPEDYARWAEIRERVRDALGTEGFVIHAVEPAMGNRFADRRKVKQCSTETDDQLLTRYAKHHGIDDKTLKVGLELL